MDGKSNKTRVNITNLMSPPELKPQENFLHGDASATTSMMGHVDNKGKGKAKPMLSPPESPAITNASYVDSDAAARDPILYPSTRDYLTSAASSLFTQTHQEQPSPKGHLHGPSDAHAEARVKKQMVKSQKRLFEVSSRMRRDDGLSELVRITARLGDCYNADRKRWRRQQRNQLKADREARIRKREREEQERRDTLAARLRNDAVTHRSKQSPIINDEIRVSNKALKPQRPNRVTKPTASSRPKSSHSQSSKGSPVKAIPAKLTPEVSPPSDVKHSPGGDGKHSDFKSLPDYCPPLSSLPNKPNWYKIDWKGIPSILTDDPNRDLLHPDEVRLAETLKLDCALYLAAKRRFFIRRLECARIKKPFRKTDAQQACRIDVNKASRLWTVFDRVGWLDERWVKPYM